MDNRLILFDYISNNLLNIVKSPPSLASRDMQCVGASGLLLRTHTLRMPYDPRTGVPGFFSILLLLHWNISVQMKLSLMLRMPSVGTLGLMFNISYCIVVLVIVIIIILPSCFKSWETVSGGFTTSYISLPNWWFSFIR